MTQDGRTPLFGASFNGHAGVVRLLLERGAGVNICDKVRRENMYKLGKFCSPYGNHQVNNTRNAHAHILPRACQPMRKQRSTDCARSQTSYESAHTAEARLPTNDGSYTS